MINNTICRVCGFDFKNYYPWGEDGNTPEYDICECCGCEFGNDDFEIESIRYYRNQWLTKTATWQKDRALYSNYKYKDEIWFHPEDRPENWNLEEQLKQISEEYK